MSLVAWLERQLIDAGIGRVDLSRRLTTTPVVCGDCGPALLMRDGTSSCCAGRGWTGHGRGWRLVMRKRGFEAAPVGGARLRLVGECDVVAVGWPVEEEVSV